MMKNLSKLRIPSNVLYGVIKCKIILTFYSGSVKGKDFGTIAAYPFLYLNISGLLLFLLSILIFVASIRVMMIKKNMNPRFIKHIVIDRGC